jgi:uncharacterized protein (TIGR03086 family)
MRSVPLLSNEGIDMTEIVSSGWDVLDAAHLAMRTTVAGLRGENLELPTPCEQWNVVQVLQHAAGDQLAYASRITGGPGPTENPFEPSGRLDQDASTIIEPALLAAADAWRTVTEGEDVATPLPQGRMPARLGAGACALDAAVHAWDVATATGQKSPLTNDLARELMTVAQSIVEPLRAYGAYAAALEATDGPDDDVARLLRYLGRRPDQAL